MESNEDFDVENEVFNMEDVLKDQSLLSESREDKDKFEFIKKTCDEYQAELWKCRIKIMNMTDYIEKLLGIIAIQNAQHNRTCH